MADIERCPVCHGVIAIIGRVHRCIPPLPLAVEPAPKPRPLDPASRAVKVRRARDPLAVQGAGPAPAKNASTTYDHRNPEQRRAYQRELMRKRRAKT